MLWNPGIWSLESGATDLRYQVETIDGAVWVTLQDDLHWITGGGNPTNRFAVMPVEHRPVDDLYVPVPGIPEVDLYVSTDGRLYLAPELPAGVTHVPLTGIRWQIN